LPSGSPMVRIMSGGYKVTSASWANTFPKAKHEVCASLSYERLAFGYDFATNGVWKMVSNRPPKLNGPDVSVGSFAPF
jgi:hypothetical protein